MGFTVLIAAVSAVFIIGVVLLVWAMRRPPTDRAARDLPYGRRKYLLTAAERSLFGVLEQTLEGEYRIFAKVRVADLLYVTKGTTERQGHMNRVISKHIDFVLCDRDALTPVLVIELDDASHDGNQRQQRDAFLDAAFSAAALPLLHVRASRSYDAAALRNQIEMHLNDGNTSPVPARDFTGQPK